MIELQDVLQALDVVLAEHPVRTEYPECLGNLVARELAPCTSPPHGWPTSIINRAGLNISPDAERLLLLFVHHQNDGDLWALAPRDISTFDEINPDGPTFSFSREP